MYLACTCHNGGPTSTAAAIDAIQGWAKTYDEWVPASDLIKYDPSRITGKPTAPPPPSTASGAFHAVSNLRHAGDASEAAPEPAIGLSNGHQQPASLQSKPRPSDKRPKKRPRTAPDGLTNGKPDTDQALQVSGIHQHVMPCCLHPTLHTEH